MSEQPKLHSSDAPNRDSLATELESLRDHFSPISFSAGGMPLGTERVMMGDTLVDRRSPLPLDNAFVQQTKDQIRSIVETIAGFANSPIEPHEFLSSALPRVAEAMGAKGAALWQHKSDSQWRLLGNHNLPLELVGGLHGAEFELPFHPTDPDISSFEQLDILESQLNDSKDDASQANQGVGKRESPSTAHLSILNAVARERQPILIPPNSIVLSRDRPVNPTEDILMYAPLPIPKEQGSYWLQVVQSPSGGLASQRGYLRFVAQMADLASDYFRSYRLRILERDRQYLSLAEQTMNDLSACVNPKRGLARLMNILREHACSEHVFLLHRETRFGRWRVAAAAGLVEIDRRADGIEQIERAASGLDSILPNGGSIPRKEFAGSDSDQDPNLKNLFKTFAISQAVWIKPIPRDVDLSTHSWELDVALLATWSGLDKPLTHCQEQCGLIARLGLSTLQIPWWKSALAASKNVRRNRFGIADPGTWSRKVQWMVGMLLLALVLAIPVPIRLHATAVLIPTAQQHIYAPIDSIVEDIMVDHGQSVTQGQPLIRLRSSTLVAEYEQTVAQQLRNAQRLTDIETRLLRETTLTSAQRDELEGERETIASLQSLEPALLARLQRQLDAMLIVAQFDGVVATWNVQGNLRDRPLRTGQWLLSLHESGSPWVLEAALPEQNAHEFRLAMRSPNEPAIATMTGTPQNKVQIRYKPDSLPRIDQKTAEPMSRDDSSTSMLRVRFDVESTTLPMESANAGATARITIPVGHGPLAWALGKDFVRKVWTQFQMWI